MKDIGSGQPLQFNVTLINSKPVGDIQLRPVKASWLNSSFTANGSVVRIMKPNFDGHDIELDVVLHHALMEDLLKLGVRTDPPIMTGSVEMKTKLTLVPGEATVAD